MSTHEPPFAPHDDEDTTTIDIESSIGWEPPEAKKYRRLREEYARRDKTIWAWNSMVEARPANEWLRPEPHEKRSKREAGDLFGTLWREGELAVLAAETGVGKSILAVQIAESIARGKKPFREPQQQMSFGPPTPPVAKLFPHPRRQRVLYLDLETSPAKMRERYTCPSPILGKLPVSYRFAAFFERSGYAEDLKAPEHFRGDMARYLRHSVDLAIRYSEANVIIIDDLASLEPSAPRSNGPARWLRRFRAMAAQGHSFLILTHLKSSPPCLGGVAAALGGRGGRNSLRPLSLSDLTLGHQIAELADTVIAIGRTTYGPEYRYIKVLKSKNAPPPVRTASDSDRALVRTASDSDRVPPAIGDVLAFQIQRTTGFSEDRNNRTRHSRVGRPRVRNPHVEKGSSPATDNTEPTELSPSVIPVSPSPLLPFSPSSAMPFLAFTYLGTAAEHDLIRDHTAEALKAQREHERELKNLQKRNPKTILADAIIDGSYARYLKGE